MHTLISAPWLRHHNILLCLGISYIHYISGSLLTREDYCSLTSSDASSFSVSAPIGVTDLFVIGQYVSF